MVALVVRELTGGIRKHIVSILDYYKDRPDDILLVTNLADADRGFKSYLLERPQFMSRLLDLPIRRSPHFFDAVHIFKLWWYLRKLARSGQEASASYADALSPTPGRSGLVLHGHGAKGGLLARVVGRLLGAKTIYTPHGGSLHSMFGHFKGAIYCAIERWLFNFTDVFLFESQYSLRAYQQLVRADSPKFVVNLNGVRVADQPQRALSSRETRFRIGAFGALRALKGYDVLIAAIPLLIDKDLNPELFIFGEGEGRASLEKLVALYGVEDRVRLPGETATPIEEMRQCEVVVQPSRFESFGYTALEAMAEMVPVVVADVGGLTEVVEHEVTGLVFKSEDPHSLARAIEHLIRHPERSRQFADAAYTRARDHFNETRMVEKIVAVYGEG